MLHHFKAANEQAREVHEQNEQAAFYQSHIPDQALLELTMAPLAEQQQATVEKIGKSTQPELYRQLGLRYLELIDKLAEFPDKQGEAQRLLDEEEERVNRAFEILLRGAPENKIREVIAKTKIRKKEIKLAREESLSETRKTEEELAEAETLFEIVRLPWPVPYIRKYAEVDLEEITDGYKSAEEAYLLGDNGSETSSINWEEQFTEVVNEAIRCLNEQNLIPKSDVPRGVITNIRPRDIIGTKTGLDLLYSAGLISKQRHESEMMGPFEVVCNSIFNTNKKFRKRS